MDRLYFTAEEVKEMLGVSRGQAYKVIKDMNLELSNKGYIVVNGKVPKAYFSEKYYGGVSKATDTDKAVQTA